ncbi:MAG: 4Fe-4S binding protein [Selenomonadaceae bacterium]|nr:4Fe-4S binding protein [Selenomonadaceae bacterium]
MREFFITEKCIRCGACKSDCPAQAIENFFINQDKCVKCGDCYEICPVGAIEQKKTLQKFFEEIFFLS